MNLSGSSLRTHRQKLGLSQAKLSELTGVSQHVLSAVELGKIELPEFAREALQTALADKTQVVALAKRSKRYREHTYIKVEQLPERVARAKETSGNTDYVRLLSDLATKHAEPKEGCLTALSLFSGCGGFSLGFSAAGFLIKGFLELEPDLRSIYKLNFPRSTELGGDITKISAEALSGFRNQLGQVDVIIGGPPCQGFSLSGKRKADDPRNTLFRHYLRFVDVFRPKVAVLENVRLLTSMKNSCGGYVKDDIYNEFLAHGYKIRFFEINAKNYGIPQHRERVIFVAVRSDLEATEPSLPYESHGISSSLFEMKSRYRTFGDACSDLAYLESGEKSEDFLHEAVSHPAHVIDWLWDVPEGCSAHENEDPNKRPPSGYCTTYKRQVWSEPASTVQTTFGMISGCRNVHPVATRSLTIREAARIQSFPDEYKFAGTLGTIRTGIGNAVPPLLAFTIANYIKNVI